MGMQVTCTTFASEQELVWAGRASNRDIKLSSHHPNNSIVWKDDHQPSLCLHAGLQ